MYWTKAHDTLLCREVLALEPYNYKKVAMRQERYGLI